ncbi:hypothetical protein OS493_024086 [Desmophyllum pertusum]|uniref:Uncharacterized protein n=1 Tax=Desmophyllum pertusum TaxID=174260 RepID=A0A9X0D1U9_9CNID|nr:hypothetical protein OS493_024086 [Desmophyllum pertusum]
MVGGKFAVVFVVLLLLDSLNAKDFRYKHYSFRKKQRLAKRYSPLEKECGTKKCQGFVGLELTKCTRQCISQACYDELYAWDELEEGEIDVRLTSFKGCVVKQLQEQESRSRNRGL